MASGSTSEMDPATIAGEIFSEITVVLKILNRFVTHVTKHILILQTENVLNEKWF